MKNNTKELSEDDFDEMELRPEYVEKLMRIKDEEGIPFKNIEELRKSIEG